MPLPYDHGDPGPRGLENTIDGDMVREEGRMGRSGGLGGGVVEEGDSGVDARAAGADAGERSKDLDEDVEKVASRGVDEGDLCSHSSVVSQGGGKNE